MCRPTPLKCHTRTLRRIQILPKNDIHPGISILIDLSLIDVDRAFSGSGKVNEPNVYHVRGLTPASLNSDIAVPIEAKANSR
jgi:hypothetical protein